MARRTDSPVGRVESSEYQELPYQPVLDWPTNFFIDQVLAHLRETGRPETCNLLFRNRLPKTAKFRIVRKIHLDQRKRPERDLAPCPMCSPNKFLSGALVFLPELKCCGVIGHCCAGKKQRDEAEREYKSRRQRDYEESLLLTTLPIIPKRGEVLEKLRPAAEEARRLYRKFRKEAHAVHGHLRELKARRGGFLFVTELIDQEESADLYGPKGFDRSSSDESTREIEFGLLSGQTAVLKEYNPVKELDNVVRILSSLDATPTEEQALEFIVSMSEAQRRAAVAIIKAIDASYAKFVAKLKDFGSFFTRENIALINAYGTHQSNPLRIEARYEMLRGVPRVSIQRWSERCQLLIGRQLYDVNFEWPQPAPDASQSEPEQR
jgi:hypothetical protein